MKPAAPASHDSGADEIELGTVTGVFGFRGEVKLHLHNPHSDLLDEIRAVVMIAPDGRRFDARLKARPGAGRRIIGRVEGVADEAAARALQGYRISVPKSALPALGDGEYYVWQIEGAEVWSDGARVGRLVDVQSPGPTDVFVIERTDGDLVFVPALSEFVSRVDVAAHRIDLVPGAFDLDIGEPEEEQA